MTVAGDTVVQEWTVLDGASAPLTGITTPAGITFTLHRQSGSTMVAASETVNWTEIGVTGHYFITFTPVNTGLYVLQLLEIDPNSLQRAYRFPNFLVYTAGSAFVPSYTEAFCSESDIERWLQQGIDSSTSPSSTEAAAFAESRAAVLMSLCAGLGYSVTPSMVTSGSRLQDMLRDANAIGAALDYTAAQILSVQPSKSDRFEYFTKLWTDYVGGPQSGFVTEIVGRIEKEIKANLVSLATDHILSGDTIAPLSGAAPTDIGIQVTMGDTY